MMAPAIMAHALFIAAPLQLLHQLNAIAEGIVHEDALEARERVVGGDPESVISGAPLDSAKVGDVECRMRLNGRMEIGIHPEMQVHVARRKPGAAARCQLDGLWQFGQAEDVDIEFPRKRLAA